MVLPKVLIVEDEECLCGLFAALIGGAELLFARTIAEAECLFNKHETALAAIMMDGTLIYPDGSRRKTAALVRMMRERGFRRPIVATSSDPDTAQELIRAGADFASGKNEMPKLFPAILESRG